MDQNEKSFRMLEFKDRYVFMTFVYARCPVETMCPLTMLKTRQLQEKWAAATTGNKELQIITVTLDPENDTPLVLRMYGERFGADHSNWKLATGDADLVKTALPSLFNVAALPQGDGTINHSVKAVLLKPGLMPKPADGWTWLDNHFDPDVVVKTILED
jgi:protein SCO1/2